MELIKPIIKIALIIIGVLICSLIMMFNKSLHYEDKIHSMKVDSALIFHKGVKQGSLTKRFGGLENEQ